MKNNSPLYIFCFVLSMTCILFGPFLELSLAEDPPEAFARIQEGEKQTVYRGEKLSFYIKLMSPGMFSGSPRFELPTLPSGLLYRVQDRPVQGSENIKGRSYATQLYEFWFFPTDVGRITLPEIRVAFSTSTQGVQGDKQYFLQTKPFTLEVKAIPGVPGDKPIIVTDDFEVSQTFTPEKEKGVVGDVVTRTISMRAKNMAAMFLPVVEIDKIQGVSIYRKPAEIHDRNERGEATAERKDVITYLFETKGDFSIPEIKISWWNSQSAALEEILLHGFDVVIAKNPKGAGDQAKTDGLPGRGFINTKILFMLLGVLTLVSYVGYKNYNSIKVYYRSRRTAKAQSEKTSFKKFQTACADNNPLDAYNCLYRWYQKHYPATNTVSFRDNKDIDPNLFKELEQLDRQLFYEKPGNAKVPWKGKKLFTLVKRLRKTGKLSQKDMAQACLGHSINY